MKRLCVLLCLGCIAPALGDSVRNEVCRITNQTARQVCTPQGCRQSVETCHGSGVLISPAHVLTVAHLLDPPGLVRVRFPDSEVSLPARVVGMDASLDLAVVELATRRAQWLRVAEEYAKPPEMVVGWGFGPSGLLLPRPAKVVGYSQFDRGGPHNRLVAQYGARDGDSGGPMLNVRNEVCAILSHTDGHRSYGTYCTPIRRFLNRLGIYPDPPRRPGREPAAPLPAAPPEREPLEPLAPPPIPPREPLEPLAPIPPRGPAPEVASQQTRGSGWFTTALLAGAAALGISGPIGLVGVWLARRGVTRIADRLQVVWDAFLDTSSTGVEEDDAAPDPVVIREGAKPSPQIVRRDREFVEIEQPSRRLRAIQMAMDEYVRRHPGARSTIETIEQFANQFESGAKE